MSHIAGCPGDTPQKHRGRSPCFHGVSILEALDRRETWRRKQKTKGDKGYGNRKGAWGKRSLEIQEGGMS